MAYTRVNFQNLPNTTTPVNATNLNNMDSAIKEHDDKLLGNTRMGIIDIDGLVAHGSFELLGITPFIDFHFNNSQSDYTSRIIEVDSGMLYIPYNLRIDGQLRRNSVAYTSGTIDFDILMSEGYYQVSTNVINGPSSSVDGILEVKKLYISNNASFTTQELFDYNTQKWYKRVKWYDQYWTNWIALN